MDSLGAPILPRLTASAYHRSDTPLCPGIQPITYLTSTSFTPVGGMVARQYVVFVAGRILCWRMLGADHFTSSSTSRAGAMACQFDAWASPGSIVHSVGASGAVAGLMGAFLVGFPKMRIRMMWLFGTWDCSRISVLDAKRTGFYRFGRFIEINSGMGPRTELDIGHHVGGFLFWCVAAVVLRYSGLGHKLNRAIEQKVSWTPEAEIVQANA